jgi:hypothetical protein
MPQIGKVLGVGVSAVYGWNQAGSALRMACLTPLERSSVHTQAVDGALLAHSLERKSVAGRLTRVLSPAHAGGAGRSLLKD